MCKNKDIKNSGAYIPKDAKINEENFNAVPPEVIYEDRRKILDIAKVKKIARGKYGTKENN